MLEGDGWKKFKDLALDSARKMLDNLAVHASLIALLFGGIVLLFYVLSIGQLPEFTLGDVAGTFLAITVTAAVVGAVLVFYCLMAGYFARSALESVYPDAAKHAVGSNVVDETSDFYTQVMRIKFLFGATCFSILVWTTVFAIFERSVLKSPFCYQLYLSSIGALSALSILIFLDWRRYQRKWLRYLFIGPLVGGVVMFAIIIASWSVDPVAVVVQSPVVQVSAKIDGQSDHRLILNWLNHIVLVSAIAMLSIALLPFFGKVLSSGAQWIASLIEIIPSPTRQNLSANCMATCTRIFGGPEDRRLIRAKIYVALVFLLIPLMAFVTSYGLASTGNAHNFNQNFFAVALMFVVLNWGSFLIRKRNARIGLGVFTAAMMFFTVPMLMQNPISFPKLLVGMLGIGNEHLATIGLSSRQCATLEAYGVSCFPDDKQVITLKNVNLLDRLGNTVVLELLVEDGNALQEKRHSVSQSADKPAATVISEGGVLATTVPAATKQASDGGAPDRRCDPLLESQLTDEDIKVLRCIELVVPKDQVVGYAVAGRRTYQGGYTLYQLPPLKEPTVVKLVGAEVAHLDTQKATVLAASVVR